MLSDADMAKLLDKDIFHKISEAADSLGLETYVVGGYVRDLFLQRPSNDIDVVVVGSGIGQGFQEDAQGACQPIRVQELRHGAGEVAWP